MKLNRTSLRRDITKTTSFAVLYVAVGFGVSYAFTGSVVIAGGIALVEPLANTLVFYFHERAWNRLDLPVRDRPVDPARRAHRPI